MKNAALAPLFSFALYPSYVHAQQCGAAYSGPPDSQSNDYFYTSTCRPGDAPEDRINIKYRVCALTDNTGFNWEGVNWVSGSQGVSRGYCLQLRHPTDSFDVLEHTRLTTRFGNIRTHAYLGLAAPLDGDRSRLTELRKILPQVSGGEQIIFSASVLVEETAEISTYTFDASGDGVEFVAFLSSSIESPANFLDLDYAVSHDIRVVADNFIAPYTLPSSFLPTDSDAEFVAGFFEENFLAERAALVLSPDREFSSVQLTGTRSGELSEALGSIPGCVFVHGTLVSCTVF